jgi:hypothetical protein
VAFQEYKLRYHEIIVTAESVSVFTIHVWVGVDIETHN